MKKSLVCPGFEFYCRTMIAGFGTMGVLLGVAMATLAPDYPRHQAVIENVAGFLLLGGFGLLGYDLQWVIAAHSLPHKP